MDFTRRLTPSAQFILVFIGSCVAVSVCQAQQATPAAARLALGKCGVSAEVPSNWEKREPRSRIVQYEYAIPSESDETPDARIIMMQAGGGIDANMTRWIGQFQSEDGAEVQEPKRETKTIAEQKVHTLDICGRYKDQPRGPMGPSTMRDGYRMLAAIIETENGNFFVKLVGEKALIEGAEQSFDDFLASLQVDNS